MKDIRWKSFFLGFLVIVLVMGSLGVFESLAAPMLEHINVYFNAVNDIVVDGQSIKPDQPIILYNDTTYVPFRYMGEIIGKEVSWDQATRTIYYGKKPANVPAKEEGRKLSHYFEEMVSADFLAEDDLIYYIPASMDTYDQCYTGNEQIFVGQSNYRVLILIPHYQNTRVQIYERLPVDYISETVRGELLYDGVPGYYSEIVLFKDLMDNYPNVEIVATNGDITKIWMPTFNQLGGEVIGADGFFENFNYKQILP